VLGRRVGGDRGGSRATVATALLKVALAGVPGEFGAVPLAIGGADIAGRVALLQETPLPVGWRVTGASATAAVTAGGLAVTQVHHLVTLVSGLC